MNTYDKIVKYSGYLASALFIMIGFIVSYEVIMRYIFNSPTIWVNEISRFLQIWATYLALTYTFHKNDFIRITVIYDKVGDKGKKILDLISAIFILIFSGFVLYYGWLIAYDSLKVWKNKLYNFRCSILSYRICDTIMFCIFGIKSAFRST